jgi:hypothetical protein
MQIRPAVCVAGIRVAIGAAVVKISALGELVAMIVKRTLHISRTASLKHGAAVVRVIDRNYVAAV